MAASVFQHITPQGTEIFVESMPHLRSCAVGFWVKRGSCHERAHEEGLAHFIEHTVFKGTEHFPTPDLMAEATDRLGGSVDAFTAKESACFYGKVLQDQLPDLIDILGDLVSSPRFDSEELARERSVILEEIAQSEDQPDDWVSELFYASFWKGAPLAHPILGDRGQVGGYGPSEARAFFDRTYRAPNLLISAAGAVEPEAFLALLEPILARIPNGIPEALPEMGRPRPFLLNVARKELQQTSLVMGFPGPHHRHADRVASNLLAHILGGGMSSRLFMELRERRGLCYQVGSYLTHYTGTGALQISASCAPGHARELVQRVIHECQELAIKGATEAELDRAKLQARTSLAFSQESSNSRMFSLAHQAIHLGGVTSLDAQEAEINAVDLAQIRRLAMELLSAPSMGLCALGTRRGSDIRAKDFAA